MSHSGEAGRIVVIHVTQTFSRSSQGDIIDAASGAGPFSSALDSYQWQMVDKRPKYCYNNAWFA